MVMPDGAGCPRIGLVEHRPNEPEEEEEEPRRPQDGCGESANQEQNQHAIPPAVLHVGRLLLVAGFRLATAYQLTCLRQLNRVFEPTGLNAN